MSATLHTTAGVLRTQTTRRYIVVRVDCARPVIQYRTDVLERAEARRRRVGKSITAIFDTVTKEQLAP